MPTDRHPAGSATRAAGTAERCFTDFGRVPLLSTADAPEADAPEPLARANSLVRAISVGTALVLSSCGVLQGPGGVGEAGYPGPDLDLPPLDETAGPAHETERDWAIAHGTLAWAHDMGLADRPMGDVIAILASTFVGTPYAPGTLEIEGPERLVVNLSTFDCVTLVEHVLVLARLTMGAGPELLGDEREFRERYREELIRVRYRDGALTGYPSRLHYFSEWMRDAERKGLVRLLSEELGGMVDPRPIRFMSDHPDSYRQLNEDPDVLDAIRGMEARITEIPRHYIPQDRIAASEGGIRDGDIIAAVSSLDGLDVAHTGIAVWRGNRLHLLHAPLVGDSVEISERPLAERIQGFSSQMGVMVARPLSPQGS